MGGLDRLLSAARFGSVDDSDVDRSAVQADIEGSREAAIAVVVPVLNEADCLGASLESLRRQTHLPRRVVVCDGGSTDDSVAVVRSMDAEVVVANRRGRGHQVAQVLPGLSEPIVLVAHADMRFPEGALARIASMLGRHPRAAGGALGHRFDHPDHFFRLVEWWDRRRGRRGMSFGDQAQFFRRQALLEVGGFPDQAIMEDIELSRRLRGWGPLLYLDCPVLVSPRQFVRRGYLRSVWSNLCLRRAYRKGGVESVTELYRRYYPEFAPDARGLAAEERFEGTFPRTAAGRWAGED